MIKEYKNIKVIGFDADDTLWVNETYFRDAEKSFAKLLSQYETLNKIDQELFKKEMKNLPLYGYGVKGFVLSMVEMALELSNNTVSNKTIQAILDLGKDMLNKPVELLDGVEEVLKNLSTNYRLILATKGDLLDQQRKLEKSGLTDYFHHIEVLIDKQEANYSKLLNHLDIKPSEFLMIGNSLKSDVLPLVNIKAHAIHVPFHTTWAHEQVNEKETNGKTYKTVAGLLDILPLLN
ncbi:HAD family hydrolase [Xanthomarina sp. F2636L]|uniref:HAD family hydrolase n=1 Tax=Xanthomarina sp. F2636L TaxID=2996018 RepID=UPI00225E2DA2|nr:HAD family hydrolase [Xanthomarina sp. F2636L]MCX7549431.1 HAD family hydrolase [Xanthomarina sp. F2636L]